MSIDDLHHSMLNPSDLFDEDFYLEQLGGERPTNSLEHYLNIGWKRGLDPSANFSTSLYLDKHADVKYSGMNPLEHYVRYGKDENRELSDSTQLAPPVVALTKYAGLSVSLARLILRAFQPNRWNGNKRGFSLVHYLDKGWFDRIPSPTNDINTRMPIIGDHIECFDSIDKSRLLENCNEYLLNESLMASLSILADHPWYERQCALIGLLSPAILDMDVVTHYLSIGRYFRLSPTPIFDIAYYVHNTVCRDDGTQVTPESAVIHYLTKGESEGARPCALFNPQYYRRHYTINDGGSLVHFVAKGAELDYLPSPTFWCTWYRKTYEVNEVNLLAHFYAVGLDEGFLPNPLIDLEFYRKKNSLASVRDAMNHYLLSGAVADTATHMLIDPGYIGQQAACDGMTKQSGETNIEFYMRNARDIDPCALFDTKYYLDRLHNEEDIEQPLAHYVDSESRGPKCPNPYFFDSTYTEFRRDVQMARVVPLMHYCSTGYRESVAVHPLVDHNYLVEKLSYLHDITPIEAVILEKAGDIGSLRRPETSPDTTNRSKWHPVALDIDRAGASYASVSGRAVRVGILAHVFYVDLMPEIVAFAENVPQPSTLLISTNSGAKQQAITAALEKSSLENWEVRVFENRGRDIMPSFLGFADRLDACDYAVHIHTKRSRHYSQSFDNWRKYLFRENGGSRARVDAILKTFEANPTLGALAPVDFGPLRKLISWGHNLKMAKGLISLSGHDVDISNVSLEFPSGSMFWFRVKALRGLLRAGLRRFHFDAEDGQVDGTLAHAVERLLFMLVETEGYDWARFCSGDKLGGYGVTSDILFARSRLLPVESLRNPIVVKFPENRPFYCRAIDNPRPRFNLLIPTADLQKGYAGVSEAIRQFRAIGDRMGPDVDFRIIATDVPFDNMTIPPDGFAISESLVEDSNMAVVPGYKRMSEPLGLRRNDRFIISAWWTAKQAFDLSDMQAKLFGTGKPGKVVYLIQDFESGFYAWSTRWALAEDTYRHPDNTIAVFNTPLLADYMLKHYKFSSAHVFKPMINESLRIPESEKLPDNAREKVVLLYARPHAERNCIDMIDAIIFHCIDIDPAFWDEWRFLAIGEDFGDDVLQSTQIEVLGRLSLEKYRKYLAKAKLGISIMVSPHPSYPPLEMAANGVKVLTNTYGQKDLSQLHENIECFTVYDPVVLAHRLKSMAMASGNAGRPLVDWFFTGGNNLDSVAESVAIELRGDLGMKS